MKLILPISQAVELTNQFTKPTGSTIYNVLGKEVKIYGGDYDAVVGRNVIFAMSHGCSAITAFPFDAEVAIHFESLTALWELLDKVCDC